MLAEQGDEEARQQRLMEQLFKQEERTNELWKTTSQKKLEKRKPAKKEDDDGMERPNILKRTRWSGITKKKKKEGKKEK